MDTEPAAPSSKTNFLAPDSLPKELTDLTSSASTSNSVTDSRLPAKTYRDRTVVDATMDTALGTTPVSATDVATTAAGASMITAKEAAVDEATLVDHQAKSHESIHASSRSPPPPRLRPPEEHVPSLAPASSRACRRRLPTGPSMAPPASKSTSWRSPCGESKSAKSPHRSAMTPSEDGGRSGGARSSKRESLPSFTSPVGAGDEYASKPLEDEIVVRTLSHSSHSPVHSNSGADEVAVEDDSDSGLTESVKSESSDPTFSSKRKRLPTQNIMADELIDRPTRGVGRPPKSVAASPSPPDSMQKSIVLGYWRDSSVPDGKDRHAVIGFIDTRERLRTRIQQTTRTGAKIPSEYPTPPGPGGTWVTFERIVFDKHLIGLDHNQVKEYVKIATDHASPDRNGARDFDERAIVNQAIRRASQNPVPESTPSPQIAYGVDLPDYVVNASRPEKKRRVGSSSFYVPLVAAESGAAVLPQLPPSNGTIMPMGSPSVASAIQQSALDLLPGTRPTKILLGFWRGSSEERPEDKHAVFGILGANDMFRVKVTRETRDGRPVFGNFPTGAGALWIHYDEVEFEKHIRHLSRPEVKEYVRVRQRQIDEGETPTQIYENEIKAVHEAQARVLTAGGGAQSTLGTAGRVDTISFASAVNISREQSRTHDTKGADSISASEGTVFRHEFPGGQETRPVGHSADSREESVPSFGSSAASGSTTGTAGAPVTRSGRHSLPNSVLLPTSHQPLTSHGSPSEPIFSQNADRVERTNSLARREVARVETIQMRNDQRAASRDVQILGGMVNGNGGLDVADNTISHASMLNESANAMAGGRSSRQTFSENIGRLNKVWAAQEASRMRADGGDAKIYNGVKYERKQTGPFQGKLVSPGTILSIDGEDYVEYRVLTKPTFF